MFFGEAQVAGIAANGYEVGKVSVDLRCARFCGHRCQYDFDRRWSRDTEKR